MIASFFHFAGVAFYAYFASGEKQHWAEPDVDPASFGYEPGYPQGELVRENTLGITRVWARQGNEGKKLKTSGKVQRMSRDAPGVRL